MTRTIDNTNATYVPEGIARPSNLSGWEVSNTFILLIPVIVCSCSIALHMPQYREFSDESKTGSARCAILYISYRCTRRVNRCTNLLELFPYAIASNTARALLRKCEMQRKGDLAGSTRTR